MQTNVFRQRHLPHWDVVDGVYFVTACLEGSIPALGLADVRRLDKELRQRPRPLSRSPKEWRAHCWKLLFARCEGWLDEQPAVRHLAAAQLANVVVDALWHFAGRRYDLLAYAVMPSHFHWVFYPRPEWIGQVNATTGDSRSTPRERIMHSVKLYTAAQCNRKRGASGRFWQEESYDHWVRDDEELERIIEYVESNPVKAGLVKFTEDWPYSSARLRMTHGIGPGDPLIRTPP